MKVNEDLKRGTAAGFGFQVEAFNPKGKSHATEIMIKISQIKK